MSMTFHETYEALSRDDNIISNGQTFERMSGEPPPETVPLSPLGYKIDAQTLTITAQLKEKLHTPSVKFNAISKPSLDSTASADRELEYEYKPNEPGFKS